MGQAGCVELRSFVDDAGMRGCRGEDDPVPLPRIRRGARRVHVVVDVDRLLEAFEALVVAAGDAGYQSEELFLRRRVSVIAGDAVGDLGCVSAWAPSP